MHKVIGFPKINELDNEVQDIWILKGDHVEDFRFCDLYAKHLA